MAADGYERTLLYRNEEGYQFGGLSPEERYLALSKANTTADTDIYLYDRTTGEMRHMTPHEGEVANGAQAFSPDGTGLYITTDEGGEFAYLARIDLESGEREPVLQPGWDVRYAYFSKPGNYLVVGINEDARTRIRMFEYPSMEEMSR